MSLRLTPKRTLRILDFDCECRPLSWYGGDWVTKEVTAISWAWIDPSNPRKSKGAVQVRLLGEGDTTVRSMLDDFRAAFDQADVVTGHFIRGFDLPLITGALMEEGMAPLGAKLAQDTKNDLLRFQGLSKSQENLGGLLGLDHPKVGMNQADWRSANRLTAEGIERARKRVVGDVRQHIEMRAVLLERGMLGPPSMWSAGDTSTESYTP